MAPEKITTKQIASNCHDTSEYTVHVWSHWNTRAAEFSKRVEGTGSTLFQSEFWLSTWYATFTTDPDREAVIVAIEDIQTSQIVLLLPLVKHREKDLTIISFADFGVADYNAPLIDPDHTFDPRADQSFDARYPQIPAQRRSSQTGENS